MEFNLLTAPYGKEISVALTSPRIRALLLARSHNSRPGLK